MEIVMEIVMVTVMDPAPPRRDTLLTEASVRAQ